VKSRPKGFEFYVHFAVYSWGFLKDSGFALPNHENIKIDSGSYNNVRYYDLPIKITDVSPVSIVARELRLTNLTGDFLSMKDTISHIQMASSNMVRIAMMDCKVGELLLEMDTVSLIDIDHSKIRRLSLHNCRLDVARMRLDLPDTLAISDLSVTKPGTIIDLTSFSNNLGKEATLIVDAESLAYLRLNYVNYQLPKDEIWPGLYDHQQQISVKQTVYSTLLSMQKKYAFSEGEEKITKEYKSFEYTKNNSASGYFLDWVDKTWWDYGYNKSLIFRNTFWIMLAFYLFNLILYKKLAHDTYPIDEFVQNDRQIYKPSLQYKLRDAAYCLFYTGYVFLGFKLDFKLLRLKNLWLAGYIILQSIIGLICLAYMANYIISK
jgi:hypothetical protein